MTDATATYTDGRAAPVPPGAVTRWHAGRPALDGPLQQDADDLTRHLRAGESLLAALPPAPRRDEEQARLAADLVTACRTLRERFIARHAEQVYDGLTAGRTRFPRLAELAFAAAERFPGLVPTRAELAAERALAQADKHGREIDQGIFFRPLIGSAMVAVSGYGAAYLVDIVAFGVAITLLRGLPSIPLPDGGRRADLGSVVEGLRFIRKRPVLWMCYSLDVVATVFAMPTALFPALAVERFHGSTETAAYLTAALAAGTFLGTVFSGWLGAVRRVGLASIAVVIAWGVALGAFGLARELWLALLLLGAAGAADTFSAVLRTSVIQRETPDELRGRTSGVLTIVGAGGPRLGDGRAGFVAGAIGPGAAAVVGGVTCVAAVLTLAAAVPSFLRYRLTPQPDEKDGPTQAPKGPEPTRGSEAETH
ncbi:MFS transporter [Streptomyces leeuwenhoekii]|uniref:MFS transporter n=1 Tax=Streptomyces leeuwenhoekii TaxID=1437453 RepID=UPI00065C7528|nr:MFS transporter [Streptomyces leeuwenhoekii]